MCEEERSMFHKMQSYLGGGWITKICCVFTELSKHFILLILSSKYLLISYHRAGTGLDAEITVLACKGLQCHGSKRDIGR